MKRDQVRGFPRSALLPGVAGTILYHSAQFFSGFDRFFGDRGDVRGFVYFMEHWYLSILGKASLLNPGIFYPTKRTLAYSDLLFGFAAPYSFFRALGFGMFTSTEFTIILLTFLAYCTAFVLLYRTLRFGLIPSCAGAMFFAFNSPKFNQLTHLQLQYVFLLPLIFALVITLAKEVETITDRKAAWLLSLAAVCLNVQLTTTFYYTWYFTVWILIFLVLALALQSAAAQKATRYIYYCVPFICALLGLALPVAIEALRTTFARRWPNHPQASRLLPLTLFAASLLASTELYRYARAAIAHDPPETVLSYGGETSWAAAKAPLDPYLRQMPFLISSNAMKAIYYFGWYDAEMNASIVRETDTGSELGNDERTGRRAFSSADSFERLLREAGDRRVLVAAETDKLGLDRGVPAGTVSVIREHCTAIAVPSQTGISAWTCPRSAAAPPEHPRGS